MADIVLEYGLDSDGGDFDSESSNGGPEILDAGNFDTGEEILFSMPVFYSIASGNNSVDPELDYSINLINASDDAIATSSLPTANGLINSVFSINVDASVTVYMAHRMALEIINNTGWDYGYFFASLGTDMDLGTISDSNNYNLDFGTFLNPSEPQLSSSVV